MTTERSLAQQAADKAAGYPAPNTTNPAYPVSTGNPAYPVDRGYVTDPSLPYPADRGAGTPEQFTGDYATRQIPDRGVTGDTTTAVPSYSPLQGDTVVTNPDGSRIVTHTDGKITHYDAAGNAFRSNVPGRQAAIDVAKENAHPTNPRFPGEGNPDFKG